MASKQEIPEASRVLACALDYLSRRENGETLELSACLRDLSPAECDEVRRLVEYATRSENDATTTLRGPRVLADRYELVERLGAGGFGQVWRARDRRLGRDVAVKVMRPLTGPPEVTRTSFEQERSALAQLHDEGVVRILDAGQSDDLVFLVTELIAGSSAAQVIATIRTATAGRPPTASDLRRAVGADPAPDGDEPDYAAAVAGLCVDLLRTLECVHAHGIVHRDIKPANVMLPAGGRPRLLDFGVAAVKDVHAGFTSWLVGTENYLAPEQIRDHRSGRDIRTDIYQTGLVLYELLCLRPAFAKTAALTMFESIRAGACARPRTVAPWVQQDLEDICLRALDPAPARRYQSAAEFRLDLERWLAGDTPTASRAGLLGRLSRRTLRLTRRHRAPLAVFAAVVGGVLAGALWFTRTPRVDRIRVVSFDPATGDAVVDLAAAHAVVFSLVGRRTAGSPEPCVRPVAVARADGKPAWSLHLEPGRARVRILAPAGFWPAQTAGDAAPRSFELRALGFAAETLTDTDAAWMAFATTLDGLPEEPGLTLPQARRALDATASRSGAPALGVDATELLTLLTDVR